MPAWLITLLPELAKVVPQLVAQIIGLYASNTNPTAADWEALVQRVTSTPFDQPPK